jgi:hypothetical protein
MIVKELKVLLDKVWDNCEVFVWDAYSDSPSSIVRLSINKDKNEILIDTSTCFGDEIK